MFGRKKMPSYYDLATYDAEEEHNDERPKPPLVNLCVAANYIGDLLQNHGQQYALMGGLAVICRGAFRTTSDVDIATNASMKQLWSIIEPKPKKVLPRLIIPNTKLLDKVMRIFVRTGPSQGDTQCKVEWLIEVDLNVFGGRSGPSDLKQHVNYVIFEVDNSVFYFHLLDIYYMMRTKLRTLTSRSCGRDVHDIIFLLTRFGREVAEISDRLNLEDRMAFVETSLIQNKGPVAVSEYQELLCL